MDSDSNDDYEEEENSYSFFDEDEALDEHTNNTSSDSEYERDLHDRTFGYRSDDGTSFSSDGLFRDSPLVSVDSREEQRPYTISEDEEDFEEVIQYSKADRGWKSNFNFHYHHYMISRMYPRYFVIDFYFFTFFFH